MSLRSRTALVEKLSRFVILAPPLLKPDVDVEILGLAAIQAFLQGLRKRSLAGFALDLSHIERPRVAAFFTFDNGPAQSLELCFGKRVKLAWRLVVHHRFFRSHHYPSYGKRAIG